MRKNKEQFGNAYGHDNQFYGQQKPGDITLTNFDKVGVNIASHNTVCLALAERNHGQENVFV